jgi:hypothetical protein
VVGSRWTGPVLRTSLAVVVLAGCAGSAVAGGRQDQRAGAASGTAATRSSAWSVSAPARALSSSDRAFLILAQEKLVARCMQAKGLTYHAVGPSSAELEAEDAAGRAPERAYGSDDVERARQEGYGLARQPGLGAAGTGAPVQDHPNTRLVQSMSPARQRAYAVALFGEARDMVTLHLPDGVQLSVSVAGCVAEARRALYGNVQRYLRLEYMVQNAGGEVVRRVLKDSRYARAVTAWRACMAGQGYRYEEATDAYAAMASRYDQRAGARAEVRRQERQLAVTDATCNRSARVAATGRRLHEEVAAIVAAQREGDVLAYRELQATALERARARGGAG